MGPTRRVSGLDGGPHAWGDNQVEAVGARDERIHPRRDKGDRGLLNPPRGSAGRTERGEAATREAVGGGCS